MKKLVLLSFQFSLLFLPRLVFAAGFTFNESACTVTAIEELTFEIESQNFRSQVMVELLFEGENVALPKLRVSFFQHAPSKVSVEWLPIQRERLGVGLFLPEVRSQILAEEGVPFEAVPVNSSGANVAVFEYQAVDLARAQSLVALFLSQNEMIMNAHTAQGDVWKTKMSLNYTDLSFRKMVTACHPTLTEGYLTASGERVPRAYEGLSPAASHWSNGYGLVAFGWIAEILPAPLTLSLSAASVSGAAQEKVGELLTLVVAKRTAREELNAATTNPEYQTLNTELSGLYVNLSRLFERYVALTAKDSSSEDSLIAQKIKEQQDLEAAIADLTRRIEQAQTDLTTTTQEIDVLGQALAPHILAIADFDQQLEAKAQRLGQIAQSLERLTAILSSQGMVLQAELAQAATGAPWSVDEIETRIEENRLRNEKILTIQTLKTQLEGMTAELALVVEKAQAQDGAARAYLVAVSENRSTGAPGVMALKRSLGVEDAWLNQARQVPSFTVATTEYFSKLNSKIETDLAASFAAKSRARDFAAEKEYHAKLYAEREAQFNELVESAKSTTGSTALANVLCPPAVLVSSRNRTRPCMTIDQALDSQYVENFFENLPPAELDKMIADLAAPWNRDQSKVDVALAAFQGEIAQPVQKLQDLVSAWGELRLVIWRLVTLQKKANALSVCQVAPSQPLFAGEIYTSSYYETVFKCEKAEVTRREGLRASLAEQLRVAEDQVAETERVYQLADQEFQVASQQFVSGTLSGIRDVIEKAQITSAFSQCVLPLQHAEVCASSIQTTIAESVSFISREQVLYTELARSVAVNIAAQTAQLSVENQTLMSEVQKATDDKASYMATYDVSGLIRARTALEEKLKGLMANQAQWQRSTTETRALLAEAATDQAALEQEASQTATQVEALVAQIRQRQPAITTHCQLIRPIGDRLVELDQALFALLAPGQSIPQGVPYSSCQIPDLTDFIPDPAALRAVPNPDLR